MDILHLEPGNKCSTTGLCPGTVPPNIFMRDWKKMTECILIKFADDLILEGQVDRL